MALGGGTFTSQNKVIPGAYINFVSAANSNIALSDRGYGAFAIELDWGPDDQIFTVDIESIQDDCLKTFGYNYTSDEMKGIRDLFKNLQTGYFYKLMNTGVKAQNTFASAKYKGARGNDIKIVIAANADDNTKFDVSTLLDNIVMDTQTVATATGLASNDFVDFKTNATLATTAGTALTGGSNGSAVTGTEYQAFLDKIESYSFNALGCLSTSSTVISLFIAFTQRMRDQVGVKFQTIVYQTESADYEGIISLENTVTDSGAIGSELIYWLVGAEAACAVNKSCTNKKYDGEYIVDTNYKQSELAAGIQAGKLMFHKVGSDVRVLTDINTLTSFTEEKSKDFAKNQTIRVLDQIGNDEAALFNTKYLGQIPNDKAGRLSLWSDIVDMANDLQTIRAIENFDSKNVTVGPGDAKDSVVITQEIEVTNAMEKLYMTVVVA
ncbi:MAG: phage tail protein [Clostridiaceae bacterium]|jgi:hypothetical protein|nr:phage tail protein [Clostridiaceae bacterium]